MAAGDIVKTIKPFHRNYIINGAFDFWQRGTTLGSGTGGRFLADRFNTYSQGSTYTTSQQAFTVGQTVVPGDPTYYHRVVVSSVGGSGNLVRTFQPIESVKSLAGKKATISFWAKADAAKPIAIELVQYFGTGGSPSATVEGIGTQQVNLTTSWQKFTISVDVPSISGKTIGTNNNDYLTPLFWFDAGSDHDSRTASLGQQSGTFDIANVMVHEGESPADFQRAGGSLEGELEKCQRYYEKSYNVDVNPGTSTGTGQYSMRVSSNANTAIILTCSFKVRKRANPSVAHYSPTGTLGNVRIHDSSTDPDATGTVDGFSTSSIRVARVGATVAQGISFHWTADAEL